MKALTLVLVVGLVGCASPHPPLGIMWATIATVEDQPVLMGYAPVRSECEALRNRAIETTPMRARVMYAECATVAAVPYRNDLGGSTSTYWTVAMSDSL